VRRLKRQYLAITPNVPAVLLVAPAATKFEVVNLSGHSNQTTACTWYLITFDGTNLMWWCAIDQTTGEAVVVQNFGAAIVEPGETLYVIGGGAGALDCVIAYVEVSPA